MSLPDVYNEIPPDVIVQPGFWLPHDIHAQIITGQTDYVYLSFANGRPARPGDPGAITIRYPLLQPGQWQTLLAMLQRNRQRLPTGKTLWQRFQTALQTLSQNFADPACAPARQALSSLPSYTGYSEPMIRITLQAMDLFALEQMPAAFDLRLTWRSAQSWQPLPGAPGRIRFYPARPWQSLLHRLPALRSRPLFSPAAFPNLLIGYAAGNVPGAAMLIAFLAQAAALPGGNPPPAVLVKNSRREPIFSPLVLHALEAIDPDLVANLAVMIWDYADAPLQTALLSQAGLVIAAAGDDTIAQLHTQIHHTRPTPRFHPHGHKVSFSAIARETLAHGLHDPAAGAALLDILALLAALDSAIWDQHGCLSARLHFVEQPPLPRGEGRGEGGFHTPADYAARLTAHLRLLAGFLPRGAWPLQHIHDRFDRYKQLEAAGQVQVFSSYQDDFLVALDHRPLTPAAFYSLVNDCQGRVIIVRPVADLMEIPSRYLRLLPPANLQSISLAAGRPGHKLDDRLLQFAAACGQCGVTALRTVGRAAFPQLPYSWDGLIPLDLLAQRPPGRFTTIEFDRPYDQIIDTYRLMQQRGAASSLA